MDPDIWYIWIYIYYMVETFVDYIMFWQAWYRSLVWHKSQATTGADRPKQGHTAYHLQPRTPNKGPMYTTRQ
jgi:hypothetical protein